MNISEKIKSTFERAEITEGHNGRIYVRIGKEELRDLAGFVYAELGGRLSTITAVDQRAGIELLYHLALNNDGLVVSVRVLVEKPGLEIGSLTDLVPAADWIEREIYEMFGLFFVGHPRLERLLLPDDWPAGEYPLRKKTFGSENELPGSPDG
ncbi:MAG: NADH-quinone oxidoreductase subunit C [Candidatus Margulisbacteria bacterium]|nr:NADH-quinone oxidoreductase subunit C [Candidatus Margulisiibacteriota bacterium]MBU1867537.1 NADH-quinone oxidoreductase subunit C [Candidatus Margulisiibacteriota bacterium]